ncbi:MAG: CHAT domain-containing tetratricopeptide repeat protein [Acidobacteriota bacterium]|nr:CHAT domain-containing tetratricopeptide repeat protein [Acidobacteriota bacterium]
MTSPGFLFFPFPHLSGVSRWLLICVALGLLTDCSSEADWQPVDTGVAYSPDQGQVIGFRFALEAGDFFQVRVVQRDNDLVLRWRSPSGDLLTVDNYTGWWGREVVSVVAAESGTHALLVESGRAGGSFRLEVDEPRPADRVTRLRAEGFIYRNRALQSEEERTARLKQAMEAFQEARDHLGLAMAWTEYGMFHRQDPEASSLLALAARTFHAAGWDGWARLAYTQLGITAHESRRVLTAETSVEDGASATNLHLARHAYDEASAIAERTGNRDGLAKNLVYVGDFYFTLGNYAEARRRFRRSEEVNRALGRVDNAREAALRLAETDYLSGRLQQAEDRLKTLIAEWQTDDPVNAAKCAMHLAWVRHLAEDDAGAERALRELSARNDLPPKLAATIHGRLGSVLRDMGNYSGAASHYARARTPGDSELETAHAAANNAELAWRRGELDPALPLLDKAEAVFAGRGHLEALNNIDYLRARAMLDKYRNGDGEACLDAAKKAVDTMTARLTRQRLLTTDLALDRDFAHLRGHLTDTVMDVYAALTEARSGAGYEEAMWSVYESMRARSLRECLQLQDSRNDPGDLLREEARLVEAIEAEEGRVRRGEADAAELRRLLTDRETLRSRILALRQQAARSAPGMPKVELSDVGKNSDLALAYHLGERRSYLWEIRNGDLRLHRLPDRRTIEEAVERAYRLITNNDPDEADQSADVTRELGDLLLGPVGPVGVEKPVWLVKDGKLNDLPFAVLSTSAGLRAHDLTLVNMPSATTAVLMRRYLAAREPAPEPLAVYADPVFSRDDVRLSGRLNAPADAARGGTRLRRERLTHTGDEADVLAALIPEARVFRGFDANRTNASPELLKRYSILHFATRGFFDPDEVTLSGIQLSAFDEDGQAVPDVLRAHELGPGGLNAELVVLSACETARVRNYRGEGAWGLSAALMSAGAGRVLVSLWQVDDAATAALMTAFYKALVEEERGPADALRRAREVVRGQAGRSAPYYWAGFVLTGEADGW